MHSRIFQLESSPVAKGDRISPDDIPEWFCMGVADYVDDLPESARQENIDWLVGAFYGICEKCGDRLVFHGDAETYFSDEFKYKKFVENLNRLRNVSLKSFVDPHSDISYILYSLQGSYDNKYGFYIWSDGDIETMDHWIRSADLTKTYYVGGIVDYHV